jgi:circadian clock protein KaiB
MKSHDRHLKEKPATRNATYHFRLFVAGDEPNSKLARENLLRLCEQHLHGNHRVEVVDVLENFQAALENNVLITPTLLVTSPPPPVMVVGTLSDTEKVLAALRLNGGE